jgi:hypothetical protein
MNPTFSIYAKGNRDKLPKAGALGFCGDDDNEEVAQSIFNKK